MSESEDSLAVQFPLRVTKAANERLQTVATSSSTDRSRVLRAAVQLGLPLLEGNPALVKRLEAGLAGGRRALVQVTEDQWEMVRELEKETGKTPSEIMGHALLLGLPFVKNALKKPDKNEFVDDTRRALLFGYPLIKGMDAYAKESGVLTIDRLATVNQGERFSNEHVESVAAMISAGLQELLNQFLSGKAKIQVATQQSADVAQGEPVSATAKPSKPAKKKPGK